MPTKTHGRYRVSYSLTDSSLQYCHTSGIEVTKVLERRDGQVSLFSGGEFLDHLPNFYISE